MKTIEAESGEHITHAQYRAAILALKEGDDVSFVFNGHTHVVLLADSKTIVAKMLTDWVREFEWRCKNLAEQELDLIMKIKEADELRALAGH